MLRYNYNYNNIPVFNCLFSMFGSETFLKIELQKAQVDPFPLVPAT